MTGPRNVASTIHEISVPAYEKPTTISRAEENACDRLGQVVYRDRGEEDPKSEG